MRIMDKWKAGDTIPWNEHNGAPLRPIQAGMFDYSGLGMGRYHSVSGKIVWCLRTEASEAAMKENVEFVYHDTMAGHTGLCLGD